MDRTGSLICGGQLESLFDPKTRQFLAQTKQSGKMLGLFLLLLPGSSLPPVLWAKREGRRGAWSKGYTVQRTALKMCSEPVQQPVLGTPSSPCSWLLLFLTSNWSPSAVLVCMENLSAFRFHSWDVTFSSCLIWPGLDQLSLLSMCPASL